MEHEIVLDLLPLYADGCCSQASRQAVEAHLFQCESCRKALQAMGTPLPTQNAAPEKPGRIRDWNASILQSVLLFLSFGLITLGVALEAASGYLDFHNSFWAFWLVIPATGFLLSLANWYFVRLYPSRRCFMLASCGLTLLLTLAAYTWCLFHYNDGAWVGLEVFFGWMVGPGIPGTLLSVLLCGLSAGASLVYARLLGKE